MIKKCALIITALIVPCASLPADHQLSASQPSSSSFESLTSKKDIKKLFNRCLENQDPSDINRLTTCLGRTQTIYNVEGHSLLIEAILQDKLPVAQAIIAQCPHYCADTEECSDEEGRHPLHLLVNEEIDPESPDLHTCIDLLTPFVNLEDATGQTPLMAARYPVVAAHLIARGADVYAKNKDNITALCSHIQSRNPKMVKFLRTQDASIDIPETKELLSKTAQDTFYGSTNTTDTALNEFFEQNVHIDLLTDMDIAFLLLPGTIEYFSAQYQEDHAQTIIDLLQKPVTEKERTKGINLIKKYLDLTPKHFMKREADPRSLKRSRRR